MIKWLCVGWLLDIINNLEVSIIMWSLSLIISRRFDYHINTWLFDQITSRAQAKSFPNTPHGLNFLLSLLRIEPMLLHKLLNTVDLHLTESLRLKTPQHLNKVTHVPKHIFLKFPPLIRFGASIFLQDHHDELRYFVEELGWRLDHCFEFG